MENATNQPVIQKGQRWSKNFVDGIRMLGRVKVGVIPLPLYAVIALIVYAAAITERLPNDLLGGFAVIMILGILLSDLGIKLPLLKHIGGTYHFISYGPIVNGILEYVQSICDGCGTHAYENLEFSLLLHRMSSNWEYSGYGSENADERNCQNFCSHYYRIYCSCCCGDGGGYGFWL